MAIWPDNINPPVIAKRLILLPVALSSSGHQNAINVPKFPKKAALVRVGPPNGGVSEALLFLEKAPAPMLVTLSGIITLVRALPAKPPAPKVVTLFGITSVTLRGAKR